MDGNGRWAEKKGLHRTAGHVEGAKVFEQITRHCEKLGIKALTVYAFSTENWSRPSEEVASIMALLREYLHDAFDFKHENIRIVFIGDRTRLGADIQRQMQEIEAVSLDNTGLILNVAVNYGGRDEILHATRELARKVQRGELLTQEIDEARFESELYTAGQPPLDMILRPSGEHRISNFMLWQCAYSEFIYMDTLWPDFTPELLDEAIREYGSRKRRFGGV
jgi:undecaprenyl diphosphate synthase